VSDALLAYLLQRQIGGDRTHLTGLGASPRASLAFVPCRTSGQRPCKRVIQPDDVKVPVGANQYRAVFSSLRSAQWIEQQPGGDPRDQLQLRRLMRSGRSWRIVAALRMLALVLLIIAAACARRCLVAR